MKVVPGDTFYISVENMLRFAPLVSPVMHRINVTVHAFFCSNRILWDNWPDFITGEATPVHPFIELPASGTAGTVYDYLGYPIDAVASMQADAFPVAAYTKIYNDYYRDENLVTEVDASQLVAGRNTDLETIAFGEPFYRAWNHDYFTACLPFAQKGDAAILPLGNFDDVFVELDIQGTPNPGMRWTDNTGTFYPSASDKNIGSDSSGANDGVVSFFDPGVGVDRAAYLDPNGNLVADTSSLVAQAADINSVRRAFRLQEFLERDARGGTRLNENNYAHFGVISSDKRLQRPEYIGGVFQRMVISEVLSTAETIDSNDDVVNPVGQFAGHGISVGGSKTTMKYTAEERGWIILIMNVNPVTAYQQGLHRTMSQFTREDYYWPSFANIGEQAVENREIYAEHSDGAGTFGYIPRYSEYKYVNSRVCGDFRTTLNFWHLGRIFTSAPTLSSGFILSSPSKRIFAVQGTTDSIYAH
jgi:hypothetical protein